MSLDNLADIQFCDTDTENIEASLITIYEAIMETKFGKKITLYPGDPVRLFIEALAVIIIQQRKIINYTGRQNLLKYSEKENLEHLGSFTSTPPLDEANATTTMRFSIAQVLESVVAIPENTRVTPDGLLIFETLEYAQIPIGELYVDVLVQCQTAGEIGNGFLPGQIIKLVDPLDYIVGVSNIDTSSKGANKEADDPYRNRIHTAPESFSVAGPSGAYQHWAKSSHQDIMDIAVYRTSPLDDLLEAQLESVLDIAAISYVALERDEKQILVADWLASAIVNVCPLLTAGGIPDQTMLDLVDTKLNNRDIRPLTDRVIVAAPESVTYDVNLIYYISSENLVAVPDIQQRVALAVNEYILWQKGKLGRDINPAQLTHLVVEAGAHRVEITTPIYAAVGVNQVPIEGTITLNYGGIENE